MRRWLAGAKDKSNNSPAGLARWLGEEDSREIAQQLQSTPAVELNRRLYLGDEPGVVELRIRVETCEVNGGLTVTAVDRLALVRAAQSAARQSELSTLLLRLSNEFIRAGFSKLDEAIDSALGTLGRFAEVSSCYLFEFDEAMSSSSKLFEWRAQAVPSTLSAFRGVTSVSMPVLFPRAAAGEELRVNDLTELGEEARTERGLLSSLSIGAFVCLPVRLQGRVIGLLGFDHHGGGRVWTDEEVMILRLSTEMFGQALDRRRTHNRLKFHVNNAPLGVLEWDGRFSLSRWSPQAEKIFGWKASEVIGRRWDEWGFVYEEDINIVAGVTARLTDGTEMSNVLINRNYTKSGEVLSCEWFNSVLRDGAGKVVSILSFVQDISQRQRDQEELAQSQRELEVLNAQLEERVEKRTAELRTVKDASDQQFRTLQAMFDAGADHVLLLDAEHRCLFVGRSFLEDLGRSADEIVGKTPQSAGLPSKLVELLTRLASEAARAGEPLREDEFSLLTARGPRSFEYSFTPIFDADGMSYRALCVGHDITERLRAALAVRESEVRYRTLAEHATDMISCHDAEGRFTYLSPACRRLLGYEPEELLGQLPRVIAHPDDRDAVIQSLARLRQTTEVVSTTFRARRKDGQLIWLESSSRDDGGEIVVVSRDVTSRLDTEQRLRLIRSAVEQVGESVTITDNQIEYPGPHIVYVNSAFTTMTGYELEDALGQSPRMLQGPKSDRRVLDQLRKSLRKGEAFFGETVNYRKDGSEYVVEWHVHPLRDGRGNTTHWVAIQRDITQRKIAADLARVHREELAHVTRLSAMGELASGLAHEINQPLAAINNYANGALRRIDAQRVKSDELAETLGRIADQSDRAGQIIRRLRAFVVKRGTLRSSEQINTLIKETLALLEADIFEHQGRVMLDLAPDHQMPVIHVDGIQIEQVLVNLIRNAFEAMAENPVDQRELVISTRFASEGQVHVTLTDLGPGLTASQRDHLFDPFFTTKDDGMGMGLTISQSIVQAHGGRLRATPNPAGRGTSFHLTLPVETEVASAE
ncbi:MAG: PAS domain S-box protein [Planctomycetota bacterium]